MNQSAQSAVFKLDIECESIMLPDRLHAKDQHGICMAHPCRYTREELENLTVKQPLLVNDKEKTKKANHTQRHDLKRSNELSR